MRSLFRKLAAGTLGVLALALLVFMMTPTVVAYASGPGQAGTSGLSLGQANLLFLKLSGGTATGQINAPSFGVTSSCYYGPNGSGGVTTNYGFCFEAGTQSLLMKNNGAEQWRFSGATGDLTTSASRNITSGGTGTMDHFIATSTTAPQFQCTGTGSCLFYSTAGNNVGLDEGAAGTSLVGVGTTFATQVQLGRAAGTTSIRGTVSVGGGTNFTTYLSGTVAVTGGSVTAGTCATQGTAITTTGSATGDACYVGLGLAPGNGLSYSCLVAANTCQIYACNASAGALTSMTATQRCTVIH